MEKDTLKWSLHTICISRFLQLWCHLYLRTKDYFKSSCFLNAINIHQIYLPNEVFFIFLFFIKTSLVLAGLMVEDQKAIFQLFLKPAFPSKVKQCLFKLPVLYASSPGESNLLCQCIAQRKASKLQNFEKAVSLLGLPKLA